MNTDSEDIEINFSTLSDLFRRNAGLVFLCVALVLALEIIFWSAREGDYESSSVIYLGRILKQPIEPPDIRHPLPQPDFSTLWGRLFFDDVFMCNLMKKNRLGQDDKDRLDMLRKEVRPNLTFAIEFSNCIKVSFRKRGEAGLAGFLNLFCRELVSRLRTFAQEDVSNYIKALQDRQNALHEKELSLTQLFGVASETASFLGSLGRYYQSDLMASRTEMERELQALQAPTLLFPIEPVLLSASDSAPLPVASQVSGKRLFLLVPLSAAGVALIVLILIAIFEKKAPIMGIKDQKLSVVQEK